MAYFSWKWKPGKVELCSDIHGTSIFISTLTLMAIAMDRYFVIVHHSSSVNINDRMSMRTCILVVTLIWLLSLLLVMPYAYHMRLTFITEPCNFWVCGEDWSMKRIKSIYGVIVMALQAMQTNYSNAGYATQCIVLRKTCRRGAMI
ncbi:hypothetical protein ANCDUO_02884 [Ancylostoma duodenale]|uniref:G-protein coupled receptors family 1 profile domain-containing protein n=1 Tax=Ancylostoma duodenale TaxID=51022 RepID=A0A0C2DAM7_9BILA|nr:hypothetical protein ANCDUO_02884 [Ancylostoma duodenale]